MSWLRRSLWGHDSDHIEYLNTKFQLRIPMNSSFSVAVKKVLPFSDDSTARSSSSSDSSVSFTRTARRQVQFCEDIIEFQPLRKVLTQADSETLWFSRSELSEIKATFRSICNRECKDPNFEEAVKRVQCLFSRQTLYVFADTDYAEVSEAEDVSCQALYYTDAARILGRDNARGLERFHYGTTTISKSIPRWQHMQRYVTIVLEAQKCAWNCPPERRAAVIASKCHSLPSIVWALASANADTESVRELFESVKHDNVHITTKQRIASAGPGRNSSSRRYR
jgi:hypothetical protein